MGGGGGPGAGFGGGVRMDVNEVFFLGGQSGSGFRLGGGQDGCERRIEVFVKIQ